MGEHQSSALSVGSVHDPAERDAERQADVVVERLVQRSRRTPETALGDASGWTSAATRSLFAGTDTFASGRLQRAPGALTPGSASGPDGGDLDDRTARRIQRASGHGAPLDPEIRPNIEAAFGSDFGSVNIHADSPLPADVGAVAFTHGSDVHLGPGQYRPDTTAGLHTLSHELAHVVQQGSAPPTRLHRLMSAEAFKKSAKEGVLQVHGKTMTEIDTQLEAYDRLKATGAHLRPGSNGIDQAINILTHLEQDIDFWMKSHVKDSGREKQRTALYALKREVTNELREKQDIRQASADMGLSGTLKMESNKFVDKMNGSASSILDKLSPAIAAAVPSPGDAAEFELVVKIPVDQSASSYVGFTLGFGVQRQDGLTTKISMKAAVNGGVKIAGVADVGLELGAFLEAQGKDPKAALQLISWGWYRRFRESLLPREVASFMWGGSTGSVGWERSETWAANIEKNNLDYADTDTPLSSGVGSNSTTNAYVRTGAYGSAAASGQIGSIATLEGSAQLSGGTHYDRDTIKARKGKRGGQIGTGESMPDRGTTTYLGTRFMKAEASLSTEVGPFSGSLGGSLEWLWDQSPKDPNKPKGEKVGARFEYLSGSLSAGATVPMGATFANKLAEGVTNMAPTVINLIKTLATKASATDKTGTAEGVGQAIAGGEGLAIGFGAFPQEAFSFVPEAIADEPTATLAEQLKSGVEVGDSASTMSINVAFGYNFWDRKDPISIDITLNSDQAFQLDASIVSVSAVRSRRLLRIKFASGRWTKPLFD